MSMSKIESDVCLSTLGTSDSRFAGGDPASPGLRVRAVEVSLPAL